MRLECRDISKHFASPRGDVLAVDRVSLAATDSEFVGIVGPSGCGKTTLLKMIAGLVEPTSGELVISNGAGPGRPRSAFVFQDHGLFPWMTVLDNVAFGLETRGVPRAERHARAGALVDRVGLGQFAGCYPNQLSSGMQQRVGIVRAFVTSPPLLLMDEPFGALDPQTRRVLQGDLLRLWGEHQNLIVFVTHDIDEAVRLSDRVLVMTGRPGRIRDAIEIPLPRPRELTSREPAEVSEIKWRIWKQLEDEVRASLAMAR